MACIALLFRQQRKLKEERAVAPPLEGVYEKNEGYQRRHPGIHNAQELPGARAVPELTDNMKNVHELGGHYMPGSQPPPPPLAK